MFSQRRAEWTLDVFLTQIKSGWKLSWSHRGQGSPAGTLGIRIHWASAGGFRGLQAHLCSPPEAHTQVILSDTGRGTPPHPIEK